MTVEFKAFPKISRDNPFKATISEKIDGTNACIIIQEGKIIGVQSRKRLIIPEDDNYGFAKWVSENTEDLLKLGNGYHYGEWAGPGIQKNPHRLEEKTLFLFNTFRRETIRDLDIPNVAVVPVLFNGILKEDTIESELLRLKNKYVGTDCKPEGIVVYYHIFRKYTKHTIVSPNGKWCKD